MNNKDSIPKEWSSQQRTLGRHRWGRMVQKGIRELRRGNLLFFLEQGFLYFQRLAGYGFWVAKTEKRPVPALKQEIARFFYKPKVSLLTPVYNVDPAWLDACIDSVVRQFYDNWELCLHDDASANPATRQCLKRWEARGDPRIKISWGTRRRHIAGASNAALAMATGEFIALLDHDDELSPLALFEVVKVLNEHPEADFIYSDEDKISERGRRQLPFFKPDWSPDLFLSMMYTCHLGVYRKEIIEGLGGFRAGYDGSQDYDLVLRLIEATSPEKIFHIPKILYHWRMLKGSAAYHQEEKQYAHAAGKKALMDYMQRNGLAGEVCDGIAPGLYRLKRSIPNQPKICLVIPFKDKGALLQRCLESIFHKTDYHNYEIILINNQSTEAETFKYLEKIQKNPLVTVHDFNKEFNYSEIINFGVDQAKSNYILCLNNDIEVINSAWLSAMVEHIQRAEVGVVGAKLFYPDDTIQHAGVIIGLGGSVGHAFQFFPRDHGGYADFLHVTRNCSAVTGACMLFKKDLFRRVGGFDARHFPINYNDIDFCLKIRELGYLVVWTPYAQLYHLESATRGLKHLMSHLKSPLYGSFAAETAHFQKRWGRYIEHDPYYNPNLTRKRPNYALRLVCTE